MNKDIKRKMYFGPLLGVLGCVLVLTFAGAGDVSALRPVDEGGGGGGTQPPPPPPPGAIGDPPLDAEEGFVDRVLPAHEAIAPADFAGVFSRIDLSSSAAAAKDASVESDFESGWRHLTPRLQRKKPPRHCRPKRSRSIQSWWRLSSRGPSRLR